MPTAVNSVLSLTSSRIVSFDVQESVHAMDEEGLSQIAQFEGFSPAIYKDVGGKPTIGYGHLVAGEEEAKYKNGITRDQADQILRNDAMSAEKSVKDLVEVPLKQNQFNALASFVFNIGRKNFKDSTLLRELNKGHYDKVGVELVRWNKVDGRVVEGLVNRRAVEASLFYSPVGTR